MKISDIKIENFRCFKSLSVSFDSQMNVFAGNNGAGKSSVLDAVSVGIGSFLLGVEGVSAPGIHKSDVRFVSYEIGSVIDRQPQFPATIACNGEVDGKEIEWTRQLNTESGLTTYGDAYSIRDIASNLQKSVRYGDKKTALPLISY